MSAVTDNDTAIMTTSVGGGPNGNLTSDIGDFQYEYLDEREDEPKQHFSFKQWLYDKLHSWDFYAKPITLTFNKKPAFATVPGGLWSCATIMLYCAFISIQILVYI